MEELVTVYKNYTFYIFLKNVYNKMLKKWDSENKNKLCFNFIIIKRCSYSNSISNMVNEV